MTSLAGKLIHGAAVLSIALVSLTSAIPIPAKFQPWILLAVSILQAIAGTEAFKVNPDGKPASQPYLPAPKSMAKAAGE
jgi:hypothetical protein